MMKPILLFILLVSTFLSFGQEKRFLRDTLSPQVYKVKKTDLKYLKNSTMPVGDFIIGSYEIMTKDAPKTKDLDRLIGTFVRLKETDITGDLIDPISIENMGIERMVKEDYIFRTFGTEPISQAENLPESIRVRKTGRQDCYGIILLSENKLALPYKGTILFLELK